MTTPTYCTATDVKRVMGLSYAFSTSTTPTLAEVNDMILDAEDEIDQITQHAWREVTVTNEYHDFPDLDAISLNTVYKFGAGMRISLGHRKIKSVDSVSGDSLLIWNGGTYEEYLTTKHQGRDGDFWFDLEEGVLYLKNRWKYSREKAVIVSYRFGDGGSVPRDISKATAYRVASDIAENDDRSQTLNETGDMKTVPQEMKAARFMRKFSRIMSNRKEFKIITW